jgi:hypothetical protein
VLTQWGATLVIKIREREREREKSFAKTALGFPLSASVTRSLVQSVWVL